MIIVGIDGSDASSQALHMAANEASLRNTDLRVVAAWEYPTPVYAGGLMPVLPSGDLDAATRSTAEHQAAEVMAEHPGVGFELVVREGNAVAVLVDESRNAELLVIGSRGHGGFAGLLLGSVSQQCAHHAGCPIVIVPPNGRSTG